MITGALEGTVCIDISGHVAGPYAGSLLGDLGCEIIKVELPDGGDTHRGRNPKYEGYGPSFRVLNRNKKSVTLNLREKKGREILLELLETADILLENLRPPTRQRLGLDYEELSKLNPKLIHCSISGYGQSGPYRDKPGFDTIGQALSGMMSLVTDLDDPKVAGISFVDHAAGIFASHGIMAALLARAKTQRGQFIDVSLLQVSIAFIESHVADYLNGGPRFDTRKQRTDRHDEIVTLLRAQFRKKPREYWLPRLDANNIPNAPINTIPEVFNNPQIKHMGIPRQITHPRMGTSNLVGSPINMSDTPPRFVRPAPLLGEQTEEILERLGYGKETIEELRTSGVV